MRSQHSRPWRSLASRSPRAIIQPWTISSRWITRVLLDAWRETLRAAELAERLALKAVAAADGVDSQAVSAATETAVEVLASAERMAAHARHMLDETESDA